MQFHHDGYVITDPRIQPAAGVGLDRMEDLPDEVDVLIVGGGPAGMLLAAQMSQFPTVNTRIIERRPGRLEVGHADGIQARSVETFQAFGFAERIVAEAYRFCATNFWAPDPDDRSRIIRTQRTEDDPRGVSEFPHLTVNQARVLDYFAEAAAYGPGRITPDYGWELLALEISDGEEFPVNISVRRTSGDDVGEERRVRAKYVVGTDGARSAVREAIGLKLEGTQAMHAWAVMDALAVTDFPDIRTKCAIQSDEGTILLIPREGGFLYRMYIDLGEVEDGDNHTIRSTTVEQAIAKANAIMHPYILDVRDVPWFSVYEVGHRLAKKFDNVAESAVGIGTPHVLISGDACHTHSAKAGQGMNVSMQDTFNLGWKLGQVVTGLSPESLLDTYSAERRAVAQNLIDFDREWSGMMAKKPGEIPPTDLAAYLVKGAEFAAGFMTEYPTSAIIGDRAHQHLASGFPVGKRFKSAPVVRVADANPIQLGHHARADGRWRIYVFADGSTVREASLLRDWSEWMLSAPDSPVQRFTAIGGELDSLFDVKVVFQGTHVEVALEEVSRLYLPLKGPYEVIDYEKVFAVDPSQDFFDARAVDRSGCVVVVRPDQYVAHVLPLTARIELTAFFDHSMFESGRATTAPVVKRPDATVH